MQIDRPITIALIVIVTLFLVFFLVMPEYKTFGQLQTQLAEKTAEFNAEYDYYAAIDRVYYDLQSHKDDISKIDNSLPDTPKDPTFGKIIYFLQQTAKDNGMIVKDLFLSKSNPGATSKIKEITFSIDLSGNYSSLESFIITLEKSVRIFEVTSISFGSAGSSLSDFSLQIKTYSY